MVLHNWWKSWTASSGQEYAEGVLHEISSFSLTLATVQMDWGVEAFEEDWESLPVPAPESRVEPDASHMVKSPIPWEDIDASIKHRLITEKRHDPDCYLACDKPVKPRLRKP
mgnify:CR=1 FL=1